MFPVPEFVPFTVHEADIAVYHSWHDGWRVNGPVDRHLVSPVVAKFRAGLRIGRSAITEVPSSFGEWRMTGNRSGSLWTIETTSPLAALADGGIQISSSLPPGTPLMIVIRFHCLDTGNWRVFQFHHAAVDEPDAGESSQTMMTSWKFKAGWLEEFKGDGTEALPSMEPRYVGVIEWRHLGRTIPCWYYDPDTDTWTETPENRILVGEQTVRYVSLDFTESGVAFSYLAARTQDATAAAIETTAIGWIDAITFSVLESSGLTLSPGWQVQTGCPEPLVIPPSGRHWEHPRVHFRHLARIYATVAHGVFAVPAFKPDTATESPFDLPIRLGRMIVLPDVTHILPAA